MIDDQPHRRVYARGYYDGLRAAGMTGDQSMGMKKPKVSQISPSALQQGLAPLLKSITHQRFEEAYSALTTQDKSVYDACPMTDQYSTTQIQQVLKRNGTQVPYVVDCLARLEARGLIEKKNNVIRRIRVEQKPLVKLVATEKKEAMPEEDFLSPVRKCAIDLQAAAAALTLAINDASASIQQALNKPTGPSEEELKAIKAAMALAEKFGIK
jgi:ribosomal protein L16 Arg81 hydroxylase